MLLQGSFSFNIQYFQVANSAIGECTNFTDMTGKDFLDPKNDKTVVAVDKTSDGTSQVKKKKTSEV